MHDLLYKIRPKSICATYRRIGNFLFSAALGSCLVQPALAADQKINSSAGWLGAPETVFDARQQGCDNLDIPDIGARAFRDDNGVVHLFSTHFSGRAMLGPSLDLVKHDCHVVYQSHEDPNPAHFADRSWLGSFYTIDGRRVVALLHTEFEAWTHPGMCAATNADWPNRANCWWNVVTMAISENGGYDFLDPEPPHNLVASVPYPYDVNNTSGAFGYDSPTNILKVGAYYYAMIEDWPHRAQKYGACLIRTTNLFDNKSWRAWDGNDFTIRFANPYVEKIKSPEEHVCTPVGGASVYTPGSLSVHSPSKKYVTIQFAPDKRFGLSGLYISTSSDMTHWGKPNLVASIESMLADEPVGRWHYNYFSLLDPNSDDRNFGTITDDPYVYYVRTDMSVGYKSATLMRRRVHVRIEP